MIFFQRKFPELISIHIPKTAGTSFRNILKTVYGNANVVRFDMVGRGKNITLDEQPYDKKHLPEAKVIHGHFFYQSLVNNFPMPKNYQLITWMRDPVKRVVSNYFYLEERLKEIIQEEKRNVNILSKMQRTLIEYARADKNRNRQTKFLTGKPLDEFDFVGIQEYFDTELVRLSNILQWPKLPPLLHHNKTSGQKPPIPEEILSEIRELNEEDMVLYEYALKIRGAQADSHSSTL